MRGPGAISPHAYHRLQRIAGSAAVQWDGCRQRQSPGLFPDDNGVGESLQDLGAPAGQAVCTEPLAKNLDPSGLLIGVHGQCCGPGATVCEGFLDQLAGDELDVKDPERRNKVAEVFSHEAPGVGGLESGRPIPIPGLLRILLVRSFRSVTLVPGAHVDDGEACGAGSLARSGSEPWQCQEIVGPGAVGEGAEVLGNAVDHPEAYVFRIAVNRGDDALLFDPIDDLLGRAVSR